MKFNKVFAVMLIFVMLIGCILPTKTALATEIENTDEGEYLAFEASNLGIISFSAPIYYQVVEGGTIREYNGDAWIDEMTTGLKGTDRERTWYVYDFSDVDAFVGFYFLKDDFYDSNGDVQLQYLHWNAIRNDAGEEQLIPEQNERDTETGIYGKSAANLFETTQVSSARVVYDYSLQRKTIFQTISEVFAIMVRGLANGLIKLINMAVGGNGVTIDDIIFNNYEPTRLAYFNLDENSGSLINEIAGTINKWTKLFTEVAIVGYLTTLLYMGIQIVFKSTAAKKAEYKRFLVDWVIGVGLLFLFPLVVKYTIEINDALVKQIEAGKIEGSNITDDSELEEYIEYAKASSTGTGTQLTSLSSDLSDEDIRNFQNSYDSNPFSKSDTNYMAIMARKAEETNNLVYAIVYLIMAWQLLLILIVYYKRLFMVGFLLVLFPLVALTYAIDKVKDGKSQAFDRWGKEIILNIFLQTFHAIIYVFAVNASLAGGDNGDWILMIMGITFLFKGEEIIKKLFGQRAESVSSLAQSAMQTAAIYTAVTHGTKKLADNFIGRNSHLGKAIRSRRNAKTYNMMANNFDTLASTGPEFVMPEASALPHAPTTMDAEATQVGRDIQTVNNRDMATSAELAMAIDRLQNYNGRHNEMLQDLNVDLDKLKAVQRVKESAIQQLKTGTEKATVEQNIKLELESIFGKKEAKKMQQVLYHQMELPLRTNHIARNTAEVFVRRELDDARRRREEIDNSFDFSPTEGSFGISEQIEESDLLFNTYGGAQVTNEQQRMARAIITLKNRGEDKFSIEQQAAAVKYILEHRNDDTSYKTMIDTALDQDVDEMTLVLAHRIREESSHSVVEPTSVIWAERMIRQYESDSRQLSDELQEITASTLYQSESPSGVQQESDDEIVDRISIRRERENRNEAELLRDFARDRIVRERTHEPTIDGMTRSDLYAMAEIERENARKEAFRSVAETSGAALAAPIGSAAGIAFAESDKGAIVEGLAGGYAGAVIGDQAVAKVIGGTREKDFILRNPYTGEDEKVTLKIGGAFDESVLRYGLDSLPEEVRGSIRAQFIATAAAKRKKEAEKRRKEIEEANRRNS